MNTVTMRDARTGTTANVERRRMGGPSLVILAQKPATSEGAAATRLSLARVCRPFADYDLRWDRRWTGIHSVEDKLLADPDDRDGLMAKGGFFETMRPNAEARDIEAALEV